MDKATEKIKEHARHAVYMCNQLIAQCNTWVEPLSTDKYMANKKRSKKRHFTNPFKYLT